MTLIELKEALLTAGWIVDHVSMRDDQPSSFYLSPRGDFSDRQIRISDHELGSRYGEPQGRWAVDVVIRPELSLADHLEAVVDDDYRGESFSLGYSFAEHQAETNA